MANIGRLVVFGCGGVLELAVLFGALIVVVGGSNQETTTEERREKGEEEVQENDEVGVGETAEMPGRAVTVNELEADFRPPRDIPRPQSGNIFYRVNVTVENTSNDTASLNPLDFSIRDSSGVERKGTTMQELPNPIALGNIAAGGTAMGNVVMEAPQGDTGLKLVYAPADLVGRDQSLVIDLQS